MRLISINLNKRLSAPDAGDKFKRWLSLQAPEIVMVQEAVPAKQSLPQSLRNLPLVGGDHQVACWAKPGLAVAFETSTIPTCIFETQNLVVSNTYLSAYSSKTRLTQIEGLAALLSNRLKPVIVVGDFNSAPAPEDGLHGENISKWTKAKERTALQRLLSVLEIVDLTARHRIGTQEFTIERLINGKWSRFRCDLALAPAGRAFCARYDHSTRRGADAFTDHSACIIDVQDNVRAGASQILSRC